MGGTRTRAGRVWVVLLLVVALAGAPGVAVAESRTGGSVVIEAGETTGDVEAFAGDVVVRGTVDGDLQAFAGNVRIQGEVTGSVEAAAGNVVVAGTVGGDVSAAGGNVEVAETGAVGGDLEAGGGTVVVNGRVDGDARVGAGQIALGPTARIGGDFEYDGELERSDGAQVGGTVTRNPDLAVGGPLPQIPALVFSAYFVLVNLVLGAVLLLAFPAFARDMVDRTVDRPGATGLVGLGALVFLPIGLGLLAVTIVGIPFTLVGLLVWGIGIWLGLVYGRYLLGAWLLSLVDRENRWLALLVGVLVMVVVTRVPIVGGLADLAVLVWGLGALALGLYGSYRKRQSEGGPAEETAGAEPGAAAG